MTINRITEGQYYDAYVRLTDDIGRLFAEAYDRNAFNHLTKGELTVTDPSVIPSTILDPTTAPTTTPDTSVDASPVDPTFHPVQPYTTDELNSRIIEQSIDLNRLGATVLMTLADADDITSLKKTVGQIAEWINGQIANQQLGQPPGATAARTAATVTAKSTK